jgi:PAS domain S-box-containing protein
MRQDTHKTKAQLLVELSKLRQRNTELEAIVADIKKSEERFRAIANYTFDWENWVGIDGRLVWVNSAVEKITGYSPEEYLNLPDRFKQIYGDDERVRAQKHIENGLIHHQSENDVEFQIRHKDGSLKWVSVSSQPMYTEKGECLGLRSSIRDISRRKLAEQALQDSEERFRTVAESSPDAILISDQNGTIIFWNKAAVKMFGYEEKGILGESYTRLLPERLRDQDRKAGQKFLKTGMLSNLKQPLETIALRKDGSEVLVEITFSSWKAQGQYCFSFIMRDVTRRKQHEEALKTSEERFRAIAESSPDAIITADNSGKILFWNKAAETIYGYKAKEIVGKSIELLRPEDKRLIDRKNRARFITTGHSRYIGKTVEGLAVRKDGTEFLSETSTSYWKAEGKVFFCGIVRDITGRKKTEKDLKQEKYFSSTVISSLPGIFYLLDRQGHFISWNKNLESVTGYTAKELQYINNLSLIHKDDRALIAEKMEDVFLNGRTAEVEAQLLSRHGKARHYLFTGRKLEIEENPYLTGVGIDITGLKRMEQQLQNAHNVLEKKVTQRTAQLALANKQLQASKDYLKKFAGMLLSAREEERKDISTTLHDELGSMAISVDSSISIAKEEVKDNNRDAALESLKKAQAALRKAVDDLRRLAADLRPPNLGILGLTPALNDFFVNFKKHSIFKITFRNNLAKKKIPDDTAIVIYRVIQEALTNITKHAKAQNVSVNLYSDKNRVHLDITDDGVGFDVDRISKKRGKLKIGIQGMKERVESLGGQFMLTSSIKEGTQLKAALPKE